MKSVYDSNLSQIVNLYESSEVVFVSNAQSGKLDIVPKVGADVRFLKITDTKREIRSGAEVTELTLANGEIVIIDNKGTHVVPKEVPTEVPEPSTPPSTPAPTPPPSEPPVKSEPPTT